MLILFRLVLFSRYLASILMFPVVLICIDRVTGETGTKWLDTEQLLTIEIPSAATTFSDLEKTRFASHSRWNAVLGYVTHDEFGLLAKKRWKDLVALQKVFERDLAPQNVVGSVKSNPKEDWQIIIRSGSEQPGKSLSKILTALAEIFAKQETDSEFREANEIRREPVKVVEEEINELEFPEVLESTIFFTVKDQWIVVSGSRATLKTTLDRMLGTATDFRPLKSSRIYQSVSRQLQLQRTTGSSLTIHLNAKLLSIGFGFLSPEQIRSWGLDEIVGIGASINLLRSESNADERDIVVSSFIKSTFPRKGIADAIRLKGMPKQLPPVPDDVVLFSFANMDWQHFFQRLNRLRESADESGAYSQWKKTQQRVAKLFGNYRQDMIVTGGTVRGWTWYMEGSRMKTSAFEQISDEKKRIRAFQDYSKTGAELVQKKFGYRDATIEGYPALLTPKSVSSRRFGFLFKNGWQIQGDESLLNELAGGKDNDSLPAVVDQMIDELQKHAKFENEVSVVAAVWPAAWNTFASTFAASMFNRTMAEQQKKMSRAEFSVLKAESMLRRRKMLSFELNEAKSKQDVVQNIQLSVAKIITDSFGKLVLIGGDNGRGLKLVAMSFPVEKYNPESPDSIGTNRNY